MPEGPKEPAEHDAGQSSRKHAGGVHPAEVGTSETKLVAHRLYEETRVRSAHAYKKYRDGDMAQTMNQP